MFVNKQLRRWTLTSAAFNIYKKLHVVYSEKERLPTERQPGVLSARSVSISMDLILISFYLFTYRINEFLDCTQNIWGYKRLTIRRLQKNKSNSTARVVRGKSTGIIRIIAKFDGKCLTRKSKRGQMSTSANYTIRLQMFVAVLGGESGIIPTCHHLRDIRNRGMQTLP